MDAKSISGALKQLRPGGAFVLHGNDLSGLQWLDTVQTRPTDDEILAGVAAYVPPPTVQEQLVALQNQVAALLAAKGA